MRFGAILKLFKKKCSHRILTKQLREMESDGLIARNIYDDETNKKVEYFLTELGKSIVPVVDMMWSWGIEHMSYYAEKIRSEYTLDNDNIIKRIPNNQHNELS